MTQDLPTDAAKDVHPCGPTVERTDTGLQIAMRALLGIIAGLLVADALKASVLAFTGSTLLCTTTWTNTAIAIAGGLFVARVVADNVLYYHEPDIATKHDDYRARVALILLDLASYTLCYAIVTRVTLPKASAVFTQASIRWLISYATLIELLHAIWCFVALHALHVDEALDRTTREAWLNDWLHLSGGSTAVGLILSGFAWCRYMPGHAEVSIPLAAATLSISVASLWVYLRVMAKQYSRRRRV